MKYTLTIIAALFLLSSCSKDSTGNVNDNVIANDSTETSGKLGCYVYNENAKTMNNFEVNLFISYEDIARDLPVLTLYTNSGGFVNFGYINYGNYYLKASGTDNGTPKSAVGAVQVVAKNSVTKNLTVTP